MSDKNYHKESGYTAQKKWQSKHMSIVTIKLLNEQKTTLQQLADEKGIPLSQLIKQALDAQYGLALSKPKDNPPAE